MKISSLSLELTDAPSLQILCYVMCSDFQQKHVCVCTCHCIHSILPRELKYRWKAEVATFERLLTMLSCAWIFAPSFALRFTQSLVTVSSVLKLGSWPLCLDIAEDVVLTVCAHRGQRLGWGVVAQREGCWWRRHKLIYHTSLWPGSLPFGHCLCLYMGVCVSIDLAVLIIFLHKNLIDMIPV